MQKLLLEYYHSENRAASQIWTVLPNMVFPQIFWGKKWRRSEHAHASYPGRQRAEKRLRMSLIRAGKPANIYLKWRNF